jgi:hypothetical protein
MDGNTQLVAQLIMKAANKQNERISYLEAQNAEMQIKLDAANERAKMTMDALHVQYDQNAKLLALVREVASGTMWNITDHCMFCGCRSDDTHTEDCLLKRATALLAELDTKEDET